MAQAAGLCGQRGKDEHGLVVCPIVRADGTEFCLFLPLLLFSEVDSILFSLCFRLLFVEDFL